MGKKLNEAWLLYRFASFLFPRFPLLFLTSLFGILAAEFPDDAAGAEFAVEARIGAGPAGVQAFLAVADFHFLADDAGVPVRVMAALIHRFHRHIIAKT